jgi:hypothetical protein
LKGSRYPERRSVLRYELIRRKCRSRRDLVDSNMRPTTSDQIGHGWLIACVLFSWKKLLKARYVSTLLAKHAKLEPT